jgi:hypothetical protein
LWGCRHSQEGLGVDAVGADVVKLVERGDDDL